MKSFLLALFTLGSVSAFASECKNIEPYKKVLTEIDQEIGSTNTVEVKINFDEINCHPDGGVTFTNISVNLNGRKLRLDSASGVDFCSLYELKERDLLADNSLIPKTVAILNNQGVGRGVSHKIRTEKYWSTSRLINVTCENW